MPKYFSLQSLNQLWQSFSARRQGFIVLAIPVLCLIGSLGTFSWLTYSIDRSQKWVEHTHQVLLESNQLLTGLLNVETGVRGYALTLRPEFLEPYNAAQSSLFGRLDRLNELVSDNPAQVSRLQAITQMTQQRVITLAKIIDRLQKSDSKSLRNGEIYRLVVQGKAETDKLRTDLAQFEQAEQSVLKRRQDELSLQRHLNEFFLWAAAIISMLGSVFALFLFSRLHQNLLEREQRLLENSDFTETIVSNVVDGVVILDRKACIESINTAAVSIFGYPFAEVVGQNLSRLLGSLPALDSCSNQDYGVEQLLGHGQQWQATGRRSNGETFPVEVSVSQIALNQRLIVIMRDITERQQAAQKLQARAQELTQLNATLAATNAELRSRNQELDQFAYVASHDLKAPLRAIASLSEWIEEDLAEQIPDENKHQMRLLRSRVKRMEALINGLLYYSRIGRTRMPVETVNVRALIEEIIDSLAPPSTFTFNIGPEMPTLNTRRLPLRQVLANLLDNALIHHPRLNGTVTVSVTDAGRWYEFTIQDDGNGIDPSYHDKIFTIFQTLQPRDVHESTGIGLAIVKKILETQGGSIRVDSQEGQGSTFRFTWLKAPLQQGNSPKLIAFEGQTMT
jgi:PAS domain S-box-containing protein